MDKRRAKVSRINPDTGAESLPEDVPFDGEHVAFPPRHKGTTLWCLYLPAHGFETIGPFYRYREVPEHYLPENRMLTVQYLDAELLPELAQGEDYSVAVGVMDKQIQAATIRPPTSDPLNAEFILEDILDAEIIG
jgi:hypothetical protein